MMLLRNDAKNWMQRENSASISVIAFPLQNNKFQHLFIDSYLILFYILCMHAYKCMQLSHYMDGFKHYNTNHQ